MARIVPYAEIQGQESLASKISPEVRRSGASRSGRPLRDVLASASGDTYRFPVSPADEQLLSQLSSSRETLRAEREAGVVNIPIGHLRDLAPDTHVRIGYVLELTESEIQELGL